MSGTRFGPLVSTWQVEEGVLETYREWMPEYLAEVERQHDLPNQTLGRPVVPDGYYGGLDFESELSGRPPAVIVVVEPASREPERSSRIYIQRYEVQVGCVVLAQDEPTARMHASLYGAGTMLLLQQGALGELAQETIMTGAPRLEWVDPEPAARRLIRSVTTFEVVVPEIVRIDGPTSPTNPIEQSQAAWPTVDRAATTTKAEALGDA